VVTDCGLVRYEREGRVAQIILNRPEKLNALNDSITADLKAAFRVFDADPDAWVGVLRGAGRAFCSGADVKERHLRPREEVARDGGGPGLGVNDLNTLMYQTANWKPVVAACHGYVIGSGVRLALGCDLVVAEEDTVFQVNEVQRGIQSSRLWATMSTRGSGSFANEVALTGRRFSGREAFAAGLLNRCVPRGEHLAAALELAGRIAENPPLGARATVRTIRFALERMEREMAALTDGYRLYLTHDFQEATRAFVEGRKPVFRGE
jgi:enoyl-CoA hydratase/carnithine racemase